MARTNGRKGVAGTIGPTARDSIVRNTVRRTELYKSKVWKTSLEIRGMMLGERSDLNQRGRKDGVPILPIYYPILLSLTVFDPKDGSPVFPFTDGGTLVNSLDPGEVDRVALVALRLSAMTEEEDKEIKNDSEQPSYSTSTS